MLRSFTFLIIVVTTIVSILAFGRPRLMEAGIFSVRDIRDRHQYYRLVTSLLLHAGGGHLLLNMLSLYSFALGLERVVGPAKTLLVYGAAGVAGGLLSLAINYRDRAYRALGASGAVAGVIFASIFLAPGGSIIIFPLPIPLPTWAYALFFIGVSLYGIGRGDTPVGHDAHLGGALAGIVLAAVIEPAMVLAQPLLLAVVGVPTVLFCVFRRRLESLMRR